MPQKLRRLDHEEFFAYLYAVADLYVRLFGEKRAKDLMSAFLDREIREDRVREI